MANLQLPEHLDAGLEASAAQQGRSKEELLEEIVVAHLEQEFPGPENFSAEQIARFKESVAQLDRGEGIASEKVEEYFADWLREIDAR